jgi:hypothetical protein
LRFILPGWFFRSSSSSSSSAGRWIVIVGFLTVAALFVGMGRSARTANDDNDVSGQAHHPIAAPDTSASKGSYSTESSYDSAPSGEADVPPPPAYSHDSSSESKGSDSALSHASGSSSSADDEEDGDEDEDEDGSSGDGYGSRTANRPGSAASTASEDGDSASPSSDEDSKEGSGSKEGSDSKEDEDDDDGDDRSKGSDSGSKSGDVDPDDKASTSGSPRDTPNPYEASSTDAEQEENHVVEDLRLAETQEVKAEEAKAQSALGKLGSGLRIGLGKLFGDKATDQEIEDIAVAVEAEVTSEVNQEIEVASEQILEDEVDKVRDRVQRLRDDGESDGAIAQGVAAQEDEDVSELRHSVDEIEGRVEKSIKTRESMAEKKILEDKLSKKLGKKVKLTFVEQEERFDGMDEVMKELPSLRGSQSAHKKRKKKKRNSSSGGGSNPEASPTKESESHPSSDPEDKGDW